MIKRFLKRIFTEPVFYLLLVLFPLFGGALYSALFLDFSYPSITFLERCIRNESCLVNKLNYHAFYTKRDGEYIALVGEPEIMLGVYANRTCFEAFHILSELVPGTKEQIVEHDICLGPIVVHVESQRKLLRDMPTEILFELKSFRRFKNANPRVLEIRSQEALLKDPHEANEASFVRS